MSCGTIGEVSVLPHPTNLIIAAIELAPYTLLTPALQEIFADAALGNTWKNRTLRRIIRTGVDGSIPIFNQIHSVLSKSFTPYYSDSNGTSISIGTYGTSTAPPAEAIWSPGIGNKRQSATPNFRYSDKLDTSIDGKFTSNLVAPPIFTDVVSDKLSISSSRDLYACVGMHLAIDPVNSVTPQFVDLGFSTINTLDTCAGHWTPLSDLELLRMSPIGVRLIIFLEKHRGWRLCEQKVRL